MNFKELHYQDTPLLIGNVWDVPSALIAAKLKFQAIGTSSSAIANMFGYKDGENLPFQLLELITQRICSKVNLPVSVDLEGGYSRIPIEIAKHIQRLSKLGVSGINIEDSSVNQKRVLLETDYFAKHLKDIKYKLQQMEVDLFFNVRTDTFLLNCPNPVEETILRAKAYKAAGADGLFVPCLTNIPDIKKIIAEIDLPLNIMCMPELPNFSVLKELGVKRISMGNFVQNKLIRQLQENLNSIQTFGNFNHLF